MAGHIDHKEPININGKWWIYNAHTRSHQPAGSAPERIKAAGRNVPRKAANVELHPRDRADEANKGSAFSTQVDILVVSYRSRESDPDGVCAKAAIDGLVHCGILANDTSKEVRQVAYRTVRVASEREEKTEIIIQSV